MSDHDVHRISQKLYEAWGSDQLTPTAMVAMSAIADMMATVVKPEGLDEWLVMPAPALDGRSILECVQQHDLDAPLDSLASLLDGGFI